MLRFFWPVGGPGAAGRRAPRGSTLRTSAAGTFPAPNLRRGRAGFSPLAGRASELLASGRGALGRAGPRVGCSRGRVGDSCARSMPAPARTPSPQPQRAAPWSPGRARAAPPAAQSANTALVCAGRWGRVPARAGCASARLGFRSPPPAAGPPRVTAEGIPCAPLLDLRWSWSGRAGAGAGLPSSGLDRASVSPSGEKHTGMGDPGAPKVLRLSTLLRPAGPAWVRSGTWGRSLRRRGCKHGEAQLEAQPEGWGTRTRPLPQAREASLWPLPRPPPPPRTECGN